MIVIERIYQLIDNLGVTINEFSKRIDVSNGYLAKQKANRANVGSQILEKILITYPQFSAEWLLTGKGEMLKQAGAVEYDAGGVTTSVLGESEGNYRTDRAEIESLRQLLEAKEAALRDKDEIIRLLRREVDLLEQIETLTRVRQKEMLTEDGKYSVKVFDSPGPERK